MIKFETELIKTIKGIVTTRTKTVVKSIGDDCAVLEFNDELFEIVSTDILVQDVHFALDTVSFLDLGYKAVAVNASDIAAMGGYAETVVVSLVVPGYVEADDVGELYKGMEKCAEMFGVTIVGGDISRGHNLVINVCILGKVEKNNIVYREGVQNKDRIFVTGPLGGSLEDKHCSFMPRIEYGRFLALNNIPTAMIDISDGIAKDLKEILVASGRKGAVIIKDKIPVSDGCNFEHAVSDGEDFELLFTVPEDKMDALKKCPFEIWEIGCVDDEFSGIFVKAGDLVEQMGEQGYEH